MIFYSRCSVTPVIPVLEIAVSLRLAGMNTLQDPDSKENYILENNLF